MVMASWVTHKIDHVLPKDDEVGYHQIVSFDLRGQVSADGFASFETKCKFRPRQRFAIFSVVTKSSRLSRRIKFQITASRNVITT
jgi:hypothetical protein